MLLVLVAWVRSIFGAILVNKGVLALIACVVIM